jgi:hypothetical protein
MSELPNEDFFKIIMKKIRNIPFNYVIKMTTGHEVLPLLEEDKEVIDEIFNISCQILEEVKEEDYSSLRPNEIGNRLEDMLRVKLNGIIPENKVAGYPNIMIERKGKTYYIEAKLAEVNQLDSSFRTFYYEPVEFTKITRDACHILVGFIHKARSIIGFKIIDLSKIKVNLKSEFNTDNKELYKHVIRAYLKDLM